MPTVPASNQAMPRHEKEIGRPFLASIRQTRARFWTHAAHWRIAIALSAVLCLLVLARTAAAEDQEPPQEPQWEITSSAAAYGHAEVKSDRGSMSMARTGVSLERSGLSLSYALVDHDFEDSDRLPFGNGRDEPWGLLHSVALAYHRLDHIQGIYGWFGGFSLSSGFEQELDNSVSGDVWLGGMLFLSPKWHVGLGAGYGASAVDSQVLPAFFLSYNRSAPEGVSFSLGFPATEVTYRFNQSWAVRMAAVLESGTYRLTDDNPTAPRGYYKTLDVGGRLGLSWTPLPMVETSLGADMLFYREFELFDSNEDRIDKYHLEDALGASAKVILHF
ncbi:hypothetical protein [Desulfocurvibacter africanus]|uniref:hypothetical protein n=1 Tax=Desulfocurvibacter africanus TaxID=873 RepID=UPI0004232F2E|nr:hypothetical protein [Desulfocurvibacter africanus]